MPTLRVANATLWIEVEGVVASLPGTCAWQLRAYFNDTAGNLYSASGCGQEPPGPVVPGIRAVHIQIDFSGIRDAIPKRATLHLQVGSTTQAAPGGRVEFLTGTREHDSQFTLPGLAQDASQG